MEAIAANILLEGLAVNALAQCETPVTLVTTDSREVCPGCIFVAFPGEKFDGLPIIDLRPKKNRIFFS